MAKAFREAPSPNKVTERSEVPLPKKCPCCNGKEIEKTKTDRQYQYEIPTEPIIREFIIEVGICKKCQQTIRGRHKLQTSNATGAARTQLGPKLHAMIAVLNKKLGLSHGKVQSLLSDFFGIKICRSQSYKSVARTAGRTEHNIDSIRRSVRGSPQAVVDETGWRVNGDNGWLHVCVGTNATLYEIDFHRDASVAKSMLGENYRGVLVHDGWAAYDQFKSCEHQTCLAHLLRRCHELIEQRTEEELAAHPLPMQIKELLLESLALRDRRDTLTEIGFDAKS